MSFQYDSSESFTPSGGFGGTVHIIYFTSAIAAAYTPAIANEAGPFSQWFKATRDNDGYTARLQDLTERFSQQERDIFLRYNRPSTHNANINN